MFPVDLRQTYVGHKTLPQFPVAICVRKVFTAANMWGVARAKLPTLLSGGGGNRDVSADFTKTVWRLTYRDRQTDGRTDGQNECYSRVIRLGKHWPHSVMFCWTALTALKHYKIHCALLPVCTVATAVKRCARIAGQFMDVTTIRIPNVH